MATNQSNHSWASMMKQQVQNVQNVGSNQILTGNSVLTNPNSLSIGVKGVTGQAHSIFRSGPDETDPFKLDTKPPSELFTGGSPMWPGITNKSEIHTAFYLNLWIQSQAPDASKYGIWISHHWDVQNYCDASNVTLMFNDYEEHLKFQAWHAQMESRFGEGFWRNAFFPTIETGQHIDGHVCAASIDKGMHIFAGIPIPKEWFTEWLWIVNNTYDKVIHVNGFWLFQNESEMVMFKLKEENNGNR